MNLLGNANKFTTAGRIGLEVTPLVRAERAGFAFVVTDTGIGIEPERLQAIFEPFHTSGSGRSGIGLTVSLAIAEQLGGTLTVASTVGQGSTFTLWLPRRSDTTPQSD